ncbi:hypothetical protein AAFC00_006230 [Neodothiora populina]|uniref:Oxidoreductase AflY n=1 Tax=Neodothiora populina TaxID=2781224 RepID=A0ABR3P4T4_9PEZI
MSMISFSNLGFGIPNFLRSSDASAQGIDLAPVEIHEIEESPEKRARTLKHFIKGNHINHSIIYHHLEFHNHAPHILGSAFLLGASVERMHDIYEKESEELEPWVDAPSEISKHDWQDYLGKREYQRAWVDFFEDQLVQFGYDWKQLLFHFLFHRKNPLINNVIAGLGHPLIHLGYALELNSPTLAIEALALVASFYNKEHEYLDDPSYTKPSPWTSESPLEVFEKMRQDSRFESIGLDSPGSETLEAVTKNPDSEALLLEFWNALTVHGHPSQFEQVQKAAIALLVSPHEHGQKYDFFLVHVLTSTHALRVVIPMIPKQYHIALVRQWWLFAVSTYIAQQRPKIDVAKIHAFDLKGKTWKHIDDDAVNGEYKLDAHFVKALRAMKVAKETWGDPDEYFLKAAVHLNETFDGWGGFGNLTAIELEAIQKREALAAKKGMPTGF